MTLFTDSDNNLRNLEQQLVREILKRNKHFSHTDDCVKNPNPQECLPCSVDHGQKPKYTFLYDGLDPNNPIEVFDLSPPTTFFASSHIIQDEQSAYSTPYSSFSAVSYSERHLQCKKFVVYRSDANPTSHDLVNNFIGNSSNSSPRFNILWKNCGRKICEEAARIARANNLDDVQSLYNLVGTELVSRTATHLRKIVGADSIVVASFYDSLHDTVIPVKDTVDVGAVLKESKSMSPKLLLPRQQSKVLCCSCCDCRANGFHVFGGNGILHSNSISILIPSYNPFHPTWIDIDRATQRGIESFVVLGHSKCGGIEALVDMRLAYKKGIHRTFGKLIDPWLMQGKDVMDSTIDFAIRHNLSKEEMYELATKEIKKWSARNIHGHTKKNVLVCYLNVKTRDVEKIDMNESIVETYNNIRNPRQKQFLYISDRTVPSHPEEYYHNHHSVELLFAA